ncbi:tail assembly chaperone [Bacillus cereus]|nr:tail assembly chaperone [Bacillus cereus]
MRFEIKGNEYELKLGFEAVVELNKKYEGGVTEIVGRCLSGDIELFKDAIYFGLFHTEKGFTRKDIDEEIKRLFAEEALTQEYIESTLREVIEENFFYKTKVLQQKKRLKKQMVAKNPEFEEMANEMYGLTTED